MTAATAAALDFPVHFMGRAEDPFFPPEVMKAAARCFPTASSITFERTGHLSYAHRPQEFTDALEDFPLSGNSRDDARGTPSWLDKDEL